ncbi:3-hydroxyacyl-CoA dehydrogenase NAD-binding domain-containing protein [Solwaraspora sp. WMMD937]|uniref:3-hydroxyacyl-CoA dehydrogenase n=1 Tax=Solwaraspora sp. WMMD937 TaxID=3016090 RepID=UPI002499BE53|nr:3-hydroxyacyl-CoA dehydrogenase NAD-binding domain-containing protein [Solwaraspora sp. WMMD937]WFE20343.1 3-hydroxyacyl-CoA dehydrogenase NAD-binding domain-containing protein [Solwaraspora sp. WMMD937]
MATVDELSVVVVGLGPMGRGIARVFAQAGARVTVVDADETSTRDNAELLRREAHRDDRPVPVTATADLTAALDGADLLVEAVVEDLAVKRDLLARVAAAGPADLVVATNTSSLSVAELGWAFGDPTRLVGLHFFNPATRMRLVEVVAGPQTAPHVVDRAQRWVAGLGKTAVRCADTPNFVVNRICRPLYYEAQLLVTQGVPAPVVDAVARGALGHRMGPLELLDFTGLHTHLASSETALREFGDPRYRPIPLTRALVRAGLTGRGAGRGYYDYAAEPPAAARQRVVRPAPAGAGPVVLTGPAADRLRGVAGLIDAADAPADAVLLYACAGDPRRCAAEVTDLVAAGRTVVLDSSDAGWLDVAPPGVGWLRLHPTAERVFAEVVHDDVAAVAETAAVTTVLAATGAGSVRLPALPGLVADRLMYTMANEAVTVVEEGTATAAAVDTALRLGMNHPVGPTEYVDRVGADRVLDGLVALARFTGDPRYRPGLLLRRQAAGAARRRS